MTAGLWFAILTQLHREFPGCASAGFLGFNPVLPGREGCICKSQRVSLALLV